MYYYLVIRKRNWVLRTIQQNDLHTELYLREGWIDHNELSTCVLTLGWVSGS